MPKSTLLALLSLVLLTACSHSGEGAHASCDQEYWNGDIGTCLPGQWIVLDAETLRQRGVPQETIVAFQSEEAVSGQFPTVAITEERLPSAVDSAEYSAASIRSVEVLAGYEHVDTKEVTVAGEDVKMHIFTAQPIDGEPRRRFHQVSMVHGDTGYTITAVSPVSIEKATADQLMLMLESVFFEKKEQ